MKKLLIALLVLVVLVIGGLLVAPFLIPVETYKRQVAAQVEAATGRALAIEGPVDLQLLPSLALKADQVSLANAPGAAEADMVRLEALEVELKVLPLLRGAVEVDRFVLIEPVIHLEVDEAGSPNWQLGGPVPDQPGADRPAPQGAPPAADEEARGGLPIKTLKLGDIRIENGTLTYRDATSGTSERIEGIDLTLDLPDLQGRLAAQGSLDYKGETVALELALDQLGAVLEGSSSALSATVEAKPVALAFEGVVAGGATPGARGALDLDIREIRALAAWLAQPLEVEGDGFRSLAIAGKLDAAPDRVAFDDVAIVFDDIQAEGAVTADLAGTVPAIRARLDVGEVDLNPYIPGAAQDGEASEQAPSSDGAGAGEGAAPREWSKEPIAIPKLDMATLDLELALDKLQVQDLELDRTVLKVALKDAVLDLDLEELALYGGQGEGAIHLDTAQQAPAIEAFFSLDGLQALPFLTAAADFERIEGTASARFELATRGRSERDFIRALGGDGEVRFADGSIVGINLAQMVRNVGAAFTGGEGSVEKTDFAELGGTFRIENGVLKNDDLKLQAPVLRLEGGGTVNLKRRTIDYRIEPKAAATLEGQGGTDQVAGILVPVDIGGTFDDPTFTPDLAAALGSAGATGEAVQQQLKQLEGQKDELEKAAKKAKRQLREGGDVKGLVEGLSGLTGEGNKKKREGKEEPDAGKPADPAEQLLKGLLGN